MKNKIIKVLFILAAILAYGLIGLAMFDTFQMASIDYGNLSLQIFVAAVLAIVSHILWMYIKMSEDL